MNAREQFKYDCAMDMSNLEGRLQEARERCARRNRLAALLQRAVIQLDEEAERLVELEAVLAKECRDVERLEGLSLTALFHTILSSKTEQLKKERQEFLQAKLRHAECLHATDAGRAEVERLQIELAELGDDLDAVYAAVLGEKETRLRGGTSEAGRRLVELAEQLADARNLRLELDEARACGSGARERLEKMIASLGSARSWGTWDMIGGGLIATAIKHSHIDAARGQARKVQGALRRFESELADVDLGEELSVEIGSFSTFADYFLDGLIFDWIVQSKIVRSREGALKTQRRVVQIVSLLNGELTKARVRVEELETERRSLIEVA